MVGLGLGDERHWSVALAVSGSDLYAGGHVHDGGRQQRPIGIAKWNGSAWSALGSGMDDPRVYALAVSGSDLYAGGYFTTAGGSAANRHRQMERQRLVGLGLGDERLTVTALAVSGSDLYAGGQFTTAGGSAAN